MWKEKAIVCRVNNTNILIEMIFKAGSFSDSVFRVTSRSSYTGKTMRQEIVKC